MEKQIMQHNFQCQCSNVKLSELPKLLRQQSFTVHELYINSLICSVTCNILICSLNKYVRYSYFFALQVFRVHYNVTIVVQKKNKWGGCSKIKTNGEVAQK